MRPEISRWWEQAREDLDTARYNAAGGKLYAAAFFRHQALEKALKALIMLRTQSLPPNTHSLAVLGREAGIPTLCHRFLKELTVEYVAARYPNVTDVMPASIYDAETIQDYLQDYLARSEEVLRWIEEEMKRSSLDFGKPWRGSSGHVG